MTKLSFIQRIGNKIRSKSSSPKSTGPSVDHREQKFVYVISHPKNLGMYKVGVTQNWKQRLATFQTYCPNKQYKMEFKLETPWFREVEKYIHEVFPSPQNNEWVRGDLQKIISVIKKQAKKGQRLNR